MAKPDASHDLCFDEQSERWDEGIPLGNGPSGAMISGKGATLRLSLDRLDLWDTRVAPETLREDFRYEELIALVRAQDQQAILERFDKFYVKRPYPTKLLAGRMDLDFGGPADRFQSRLSLESATAQIDLRFGNTDLVLRTFLHATDGYGYLSIKGDAPMPAMRLLPPGFLQHAETREAFGYPAAEIEEDGDVSWLHQRTCQELEWAIVVARAEREHGVDAAWTVATQSDGPDWLETAKDTVRHAVGLGFDKASIRHRQWWRRYWSESEIDLPDKAAERDWYLANYFFACSSRSGCPLFPLQGVWTEDEGEPPPWHGDYHHDLNTQMSYWHAMKANHVDEGKVLADFLWDLRGAARAFAARFFDAPGICLPSVMDIKGQPLGGWPQYCTNLINQAWLCQTFDHVWRYTGDDEFLRNRAYPYLCQSAECLLRWLSPGDGGKLTLPLSSSPEIHGDAFEAWLTPNSNNDLALLIYLFRTLAEMADRLENGQSDRWRRTLACLPELAVNDDDVLMLSPDESLAESHRHHSHAMAIYPLELLDCRASDRERSIIHETVRNLEFLGTGLWVGFSFPWIAILYAKQGNGEGAAYQLKLFRENFCSRNGLNLNGDFKRRGVSGHHYRPFTLETNFAAACALQEMLLETAGGVLRAFPAVPDDWKQSSVSFHNLRGEGGVLVDAQMERGRLTQMSLRATRPGTFIVVNTFDRETLAVQRGARRQTVTCPAGGRFEIALGREETCVITAP